MADRVWPGSFYRRPIAGKLVVGSSPLLLQHRRVDYLPIRRMCPGRLFRSYPDNPGWWLGYRRGIATAFGAIDGRVSAGVCAVPFSSRSRLGISRERFEKFLVQRFARRFSNTAALAAGLAIDRPLALAVCPSLVAGSAFDTGGFFRNLYRRRRLPDGRHPRQERRSLSDTGRILAS